MTSLSFLALVAVAGIIVAFCEWKAARRWERRANYWFERANIADAAGCRRPQSFTSICREGRAEPLTSSELAELMRGS